MAEDDTTPLTWEDIAPPPIPTTTNTTWDSTPFLSAPAVKAKSSQDGKVNLLNIPRSKIPSPLADNLSPRQIIDIRESLLGKDGEGDNCGGNGKEIWLSWKRAWGLWNNHYIEDRVNPVWVGEEWERREQAKREWDRGRDDRRRMKEREKAAAAAPAPLGSPFRSPLRPEHEVPRPKPMLERDMFGIPEDLAHESTVSGPSIVIGPKTRRRRAKSAWDPAADRPRVVGPHHGRIVDVPEESDLELPNSSADSFVKFIDEPEEPSDSEPPPKPTTNLDGSSAGWFPVKELPDYFEPEEDKWDGKQWVDSVTNTVWRPRRVGEKTLQIDLDKDIEHFRKKTEFKTDGGVDCGRSPFPVLRPITQYVRTSEGAFRKKKAWDGVTGTIFNTPTSPLEPCPESNDEKSQRVRDMYSDPIRDPMDFKVFPLDIRRVLKVRREIEKPRDICDEGEELVRDPKLYLTKEYRHMREDDPWWVEDSQKLARDAPPRCHPPKNESTTLGENLPLDDQLWKEEASRDLQHDAGYFITNLHGGTLVVNGMEIKKGDVAGPLPAFAIIESPGGQVSFWWGVGGRHYGAGPEGIDLSSKWEILRKEPGWEHIAESAGEVWDTKIKDRKEREKTGEDEDDDEEWERYKRTKAANKPPEANVEESTQLGRYGPLPNFTNDDDELKLLYFQEEETKQMLAVKSKVSSLTYPDKTAFWPGTAPKAELSHELPQTVKDDRWRRGRNAQILLQQAVNEKVAKEKANLREKEFENEKRQAEELLQSVRKRYKMNDKARKAAAARAVRRNQAANDAKAKRELDKAIEEKYLNDTAATASMFRDSGLNAEEQVESFHKWKKAEEHRLEKERQRINKGRRKAGLPEIPPPEKLDPAIVEAAIAQQKEDARTKDKQRKAQDAARHVPDSANQRARDSANRNRLADAAGHAQHLADQQAQRARDEAERKRIAEADQLKRDEAERKRKAEPDQLQRDEAERKRIVEVRHAHELADRQAQQDEAERKRKADQAQRDEVKRKPRTDAEQARRDEAEKKRIADATSFAQTVQGQLIALRTQYYATPEGSAKVRVAQAYMDRLYAPRSQAEKDSYLAWFRPLDVSETGPINKMARDAQRTIQEAKDAAAKTQAEKIKPTATTPEPFPTSFFTTKPPVSTPPVTMRPSIKIKARSAAKPPPPPITPPPAVTSPVTISPSAKYPSTINQSLQHAIEEGDLWDPEVQRAIENSLKTFAVEANESLSLRAASMNMTEDQYAQSQGYANAAAYLAAHVQGATEDTQPSPVASQKPKTEKAKRDSHLEEYKNDMLKAIKEGIVNRGHILGFQIPDNFTKGRGYASLDVWAEAELKKMNITLDMVPSRKHTSEMTSAEQSYDDAVWREWVGRLNAAAQWEKKIASLPQGPRWTKARKDRGKTYAAI